MFLLMLSKWASDGAGVFGVYAFVDLIPFVDIEFEALDLLEGHMILHLIIQSALW